MVENKNGETPHVMVNPVLIEREFIDSIGEIGPDQLTVGNAKRLVLQYAMLKTVNYILAGANSTDLEERSDMFQGAVDWLGLINKTNENDWTDLIEEVKIVGALIEEGWVGGSDKTPKVIYRMVELIEVSQKP